MTDRQLLEKLQAENKALRAEIRKPKRDPVAEALYAENKEARGRIRDLEREVKPFRDRAKAQEELARMVMEAKPLPWLLKPRTSVTRDPGVPVIDLSDLHMNETVRVEEIAYRNEFSPEIARDRLARVFQGALDLAFSHTVRPAGHRYPGAVVILAGDLFDNLSTLVHLADPAALPLRKSLTLVITGLSQGLRALVDEFGRLLVVCVPGNHGRTTAKMPMASPSDTSLDAVIYDRLREHHLLADRAIDWVVAPGDEARFLVWDHAFVATHGYQYRGGTARSARSGRSPAA